MKFIRIFNYLLISICFVLKGFDVFITYLVIENGGVELNPLGFNSFTIIMGFIVIIPLIFVNILSQDKIILYIVNFSSIAMIVMIGIVINIGVVLL